MVPSKNRNHIGQKKKEKRTNNDLQNIYIKDSHAKMILITNIHKRKKNKCSLLEEGQTKQ
jgi:hypothetical protein